MKCRPGWLWGGIAAAGVAAEVHALASRHPDCTLSAMTRKVCHTRTRGGRVAFTLSAAAITGWFVHHILQN